MVIALTWLMEEPWETGFSTGLIPSGKVRGECLFHLDQGKSGKFAMVREKLHFGNVGQEKMSFLIITEVFDLFIYI